MRPHDRNPEPIISPDGRQVWDGHQWQPREPDAGAPAVKYEWDSLGQLGGQEQRPPSPPGTVSPDGHYRWDGSQWQPVSPPVPAQKAGHTVRNLVIGVAVILVLVAIANAGKSSTSTSPSGGSVGGGGVPAAATPNATPKAIHVTAKVGQPMTDQANQSVTVQAVERNFVSSNEFERPGAGKECVRVTLLLANGSTGQWSSPLYEMHVVDAKGQKYDGAYSCATSDESDHIDSLVAGGHAPGRVVFEVPKGVPLNFTWTPSSFSDDSLVTTL